MSDKLIGQVKQLIDLGVGNNIRLDSILDQLNRGKPLYTSDQRYVDDLISKFLSSQIDREATSLFDNARNMKEIKKSADPKRIKKSRKILKICLIAFGILLVLVLGPMIWYLNYLHDLLSNTNGMNFPDFDKHNTFNPDNFKYYDSLSQKMTDGCHPAIVDGQITCN